MTGLPTELQPWWKELAIFPAPLALRLGPLVRRLALAIGPLSVEQPDATGEPSGYDGLSRRGSYERLLTSEWLLLDEAPDEFLRRAGSAEHGFLHLGRRAPPTAHGCVALLDAGPAQLGTPRIGQLALLLALAARAEAASATFRWAALQGEGGKLFDEVTPATVQAFLHARSAREATDRELAGLRDRAGATAAQSELWLVGGARLGSLPAAAGASLALVRDVVEPGLRQLHVEVLPLGRPRAEALLELPTGDACARLLRDPFSSSPAQLRRLQGRIQGAQLLFSGGGRVLFRLASGAVGAAPVPNSPREPAGNITYARPARGSLLLGATTDRRALVTLTASGPELTLARTGRKDEKFPAKGVQAAAAGVLSPLSRLWWPASTETSWLFADGHGVLHELSLHRGVQRLRPGVRGLHPVDVGPLVVTALPHPQGGAAWELRKLSSSGDEPLLSGRAALVSEVFFAHHGGVSPQRRCVGVALRTGADVFTLWGETETTAEVPRGCEVVGLLTAQAGEAARLVAIDQGREALVALGTGRPEPLWKVAGGILAAATNPHGDELAVLTRAGELVVYSRRWKAEVLRLLPEEAT